MDGLSNAELERSRQYHRPRYVLLIVDVVLGLALLTALTFVSVPGRWWAAAVLAPLVINLILSAARLPLAWWRHQQDVRFGLTSQPTRAWVSDRAKSVAVGGTFSVLGLAPLFAVAHVFPHAWPWVAAPAAAALVFVVGFLAPVVLEPVFNRFEPLADEELATDLRRLATEAGAPVREILVADASRRTHRQNAYVSGIGRTRRVVLWDTLLAAPAAELRVVVAHELAHRARRHVALGTALAMGGAAAFVGLVRLVRAHPSPRDTALILLLGAAAELGLAPLASALSRHFERVADRFSLALTGDRAAFVSLHHRLALANLADLDPPKALYWWAWSHPTPSQRINDA